MTEKSREQKRQYRFVMRELVAREVKRKYARSYLGVFWSVLNPLLSMAVLSLIFSHMFQRSIENYPVYYLTGLLIWNLFTGATNSAMTALADNKGLLIKVKFPMEIFVSARVYTALIQFGYSLIPYGVILLVFRIRLCWTVLLFPLILFFLLFFSMGTSFVLSIVYVFFGDIKHLYSVLLTLLLYCSAIFYPVGLLPGYARLLVSLNPVYSYIRCARDCVLYGIVPSWFFLFQMIFWGIFFFGAGTWLFEKNRGKLLQKL